MDLLKLQNGSDIRGVALPGVPGEDVNLTEEAVEAIAGGFVRWLCARIPEGTKLRISIGRDSRLSGPALSEALGAALARAGAEVTDLGLATTPAMFMSTVTPRYKFTAAVMITASHLPWNRNGLKFFTARGGAESADIREILTLAGEAFPAAAVPGKRKKGRFMDRYAAFLRKKITDAAGRARPLTGLRIVVDAGNGAGGFFVSQVLQPLGADTTGSRFLTPNGRFPNHVPNPELPEAMESIRSAVLDNHANFGIIFDTDVDRAGAVLQNGEELNRNRLIALISAILLREHPGTAIVTDSITSTGLASFIAEKGGIHRRFRRGYRNVINEAIRLNREGVDCQLAIETSGHAALKENWFLDDGAYLITRLLMELACGRNLETLIRGLPEPVEGREFRLGITDPDFKTRGQAVLDALSAYARDREGWTEAPDNCEGVRCSLDRSHGDGWFLLRLSLHEPILPLNIESDSPGGLRQIAGELAPFLETAEGIDASPLLDYLKQ
ncbi:MAG: phosphomannomutase/phosphoglucomutase [Oscillospiraceae bacterium]|nr:phosphomannomutase/phosphoglucomutase [Oscillospiraceae bacterium]